MKIAVVGAGIIGLTTACILQESGHKVKVFSWHSLSDITSSVAAAMIYPYGVEDTPRIQKWLADSDRYLEEIQFEKDAGVGPVNWKKCAQHLDTPIPDFFHHLRRARVLKNHEIPKGFVKGIGAEIFMINSQIHLPYILRRFEIAGGIFELRKIENLESLSSYDLVVNASGVYVSELIDDPSVQPSRGQIVLVRNPGFDYHFSSFEGRHYIYPRGQECILGGSFDMGVWDRTPDPALTRQILDWSANFDERFRDIEIIDVKVGLRPMRPTVRLELEKIGKLHVLHNYGHGGSGYTLAWGCAFAAREMVAGL